MAWQDAVQEWSAIADEDLEVAELCFNGKKYLHAAYMCQQAVEKALKGTFTACNEETAPPIHNLSSLARESGISGELTSEQLIFLRALTTYAIEARYPERKIKLLDQCTKEEVEKILDSSKVVVTWLQQKALIKLSQGTP